MSDLSKYTGGWKKKLTANRKRETNVNKIDLEAAPTRIKCAT